MTFLPARRAAAVLTLLLLGLAGCGTDPEPAMDPHAELLARPRLEQAVERYQQMQRRISDAVDAVVGPRPWADRGEPDGGPCGGRFAQDPDGQFRVLPRTGFDGAVTDQQWPRVADAVSAVLREYGFSTDGLLLVDRPGEHEINAIEGATGATLSFGTQVNTTLSITTGCHLPTANR